MWLLDKIKYAAPPFFGAMTHILNVIGSEAVSCSIYIISVSLFLV